MDKYGPTVASTYSLALTVPSHLGLWLITKYPFENDHILMYALLLIGGKSFIFLALGSF